MKKKSIVEEIKLRYLPTNIQQTPIQSSKVAYSVLSEYFDKDTIALHETFVVIYLNHQNCIKGIHKHSTGGISSTIADIRLILSVALKSASSGMILAHNHPSGSLKPSKNDLELTEKLNAACKLMDIRLQDHLILSPEGYYYSMADAHDM
jgi:DNA repair protein RadC